MKKLIVLSIVMFFAFINNAESKLRSNEAEFNYFYHTLAPYGEWIELEYDFFVWRPNRVGRNWSPYSDGRWVWSSDGWYWDSYEPFGWATYHYGRWYYDSFYGWVWTPGNEWAPAWVEWRFDDNYIGWAPLPPYAHFRVDSGIHFSITWHSPYSRWRFVKYNRFTHNHISNYYVRQHSVRNFFSRTKHLTNYNYEERRIVNRGIRRSDIEKRGRIKIRKTEMQNVSSIRNRNSEISDRDSVRVFRPSEIRAERSRNEKTNSFSKTSDRFLQREKAERTSKRIKKTKDDTRNGYNTYHGRTRTKKDLDFLVQKSERVKKDKQTKTTSEKSSARKTEKNSNNTNKVIKKTRVIKSNNTKSTSRRNVKNEKPKSKTNSITLIKRESMTSTKRKNR